MLDEDILEEENKNVIEYNAAPTAAEFHLDDSYFRLIQGPVGSGKSTACIFEILMRASKQAPSRDKVRRTRCAIIRSTYPELKTTTINTWKKWVPERVCPIVYDIPIRGLYKQPLNDGTSIELEVIFLALDRPEDVSKLLSLDLTFAWINEVREIDEEIFKYLRGRIKRYPLDAYDKPSWWGIIADTNPPKTTHWTYRVFQEDETPKTFKLFRQPPAVCWDNDEDKWVVNPDAENLKILTSGYYEDQIAGNTDDYIRVMLAGEYGMTMLGKPVFPQYSEKDHVAKQNLQPDRSMPLMLGFDFGLNPACVIAQLSRLGGLRILDCLSPADEDLETFMTDYVNPLLHKKYAQFRIVAVGDPAARGRSGLDKRTPFDVLMKFGNIKCQPAHTNSFVPRKEAVDFFLNRRDGFQIDPRITHLREAFGGGYVYDEIKGQRGRHKERPNKLNPYSHAMDGVQYICLYARGGAARRPVNRGAGDKNPNRFLWA